MGKNKGTYTVLKRKNKFVISYIEEAKITYLDKYAFDRVEDAEDYLSKNKAEIILCVSEIKKEEETRKQEAIAAKNAKEEEKAKKKEEKTKKKEEKKKKKEEKKKKKNGLVRFIAGFLAAVITLVGGHYLVAGIAKLRKEKDDSKSESAYEQTYGEETKLDPNLGVEETIAEETTNDLNISQDIDNIIEKDEALNQENFEELVAEFAQEFVDNNVNVTTEDLTKFVSIVNIEQLKEENPELAGQLFGTQTKEVYLADAAKVIGMTYTYNRQVFEKEGSTKNFIRISNSVYGDQKEKLQVIEGYVDSIAKVRDNAEEVNELVAELLDKLGDPTSEISYLDNGVGFGMQVSIELIRSYLAKDTLNKENRDMLTVLTSSEEYVANIFTIYDSCLSSGYSLSKSK